MNTREKVIKGLEYCGSDMRCNGKCPYYAQEFCESELARDALKLIFGQEEELASKQRTISNLMREINLMVDTTRRFNGGR